MGKRFLPTHVPGGQVSFGRRPGALPVEPTGLSAGARRRTLDDLGKLDAINHREFGDPEILTRIAQYEMAFRMQSFGPRVD